MYANLIHNMSTCYGLNGEIERWINFLEQSQRIYHKLELDDRLGNSYGTMGNAYKSSGKYETAIEYYNKLDNYSLAYQDKYYYLYRRNN